MFGGGSSGTSSTLLGGVLPWLDGIVEEGSTSRPIPITQVDLQLAASQRLVIPEDDELNSVLGGGLMKGAIVNIVGWPPRRWQIYLGLANGVASGILVSPSHWHWYGTVHNH
jgi:hypothetical protein